MKGISNSQIKKMQDYMLTTVKYHYNEPEYFTKAIHKVDDFINAACELYIMEWKDRDAVRKVIFAPALEECDRISKERRQQAG